MPHAITKSMKPITQKSRFFDGNLLFGCHVYSLFGNKKWIVRCLFVASGFLPTAASASDFTINNGNSTELSGQWTFYPGKLLTGFDLSLYAKDPSDEPVKMSAKVPNNWQNYTLPDGQKFNSKGVGTFTTQISGFQPGELYAVRLNFAGSAHRIYAGDEAQPLCGAGRVAESAAEHEPDYRHVLCRFTATAETMRLTIQVANFLHAAGGLRDAPFIGPERVIWRDYLTQSTLFFGIIAFLIGALSLLIVASITHGGDRRPLFMAGVSLAILIYTLGVSIRLGRELFEFYDFYLQARLNMAILPFAAAMFMGYIFSWFEKSRLKKAGLSLSGTLVCLACAYLVLPLEWIMRVYYANLMATALWSLLILGAMVHLYTKYKVRSWALAIEILLILLTIILAILRTMHFIEAPMVELYGILGFILIETSRGVVEMSLTYRQRRSMVRQSKAELERLSLFIPREHLGPLTRNWKDDLAPGKFYETEGCIMFIRLEPRERNIDQELLFDLHASFAEEIANYTAQMRGIVERISVGRYIISFIDDPAVAVRLAVILRSLVRQWDENLGHYLIYRCGIHYGPAVWGIYGSPERWSGGYIGDTINTAARLETLCVRYRTSILLSQDAYFQSAHYDEYLTRMLEPVRLKGKADHTFVYEVLAGLPEDRLEKVRSTLGEFGRGLQAYLNHDLAHALLYFEIVCGKNPDDHVAKYYLERVQKMLDFSLDTEFNPIEALTQK